MKYGDVFKSECGYRAALSIYLDGPVIRNCPWFETEEEALECVRRDVYKNEVKQKYHIDLENKQIIIEESVNEEILFNTFSTKREMLNQYKKYVNAAGFSDDEMREFDFEVWKEWKRYIK